MLNKIRKYLKAVCNYRKSKLFMWVIFYVFLIWFTLFFFFLVFQKVGFLIFGRSKSWTHFDEGNVIKKISELWKNTSCGSRATFFYQSWTDIRRQISIVWKSCLCKYLIKDVKVNCYCEHLFTYTTIQNQIG